MIRKLLAPEAQYDDPGNAPASVNAKKDITTDRYERSADVDHASRYVKYLYLEPMTGALKYKSLYEDLQNWNTLIMYILKAWNLLEVWLAAWFCIQSN